MPSSPLMRRYPVGAIVQHRDGYIFVKRDDGWIAQHRLVAEAAHGELNKGDRVYHIDGDRTNNNKDNLVVLHFNTTRYHLLKTRRILYLPK